jgi:thiol:disulfide interchange protein
MNRAGRARSRRLLMSFGAALLCLPFAAAAQTRVVTEHVAVELLAHAPSGALPGQSLMLGLSFQHQPHWHTYWRNPGDSGLPISMEWQLPEGVTAGEIAWPTPAALPLGPLLNYGYDSDVLLPVEITLADSFTGDLDVKLHAEWLVCKEDCYPESGTFSLRIPPPPAVIAHAAQFAAAMARIPHELDARNSSARVDADALDVEISGLPANFQQQRLRFFSETGGMIEHAATMEQHWQGDHWRARMPLSRQRSESPEVLYAVVTAPGSATGVRVRLPLAWSASADKAAAGAVQITPAMPLANTPGFLLAIGFALLGGVLLNLMPCVFPVLALKVFDFATPGHDRRERVLAGIAFTVGVVVSFLALAALLITLRAGGEQFGWGFQLQSPTFVAVLAALFTVIGLSFAGVFDFGRVLPNRIATLRARQPLVDHALSGALAVAVASPCTGPFMGAALGATLTLPVAQALMVFAALGLGMAAPFMLLSLVPALVRWLPRPGVWMLRLKVLMAFPMFATVVWLLWVLGQQVGSDGMASMLALLVALAFLAWAVGSADFSRRERFGFTATALLVLIGTLVWAAPGIRSTPAASLVPSVQARWQPWSTEAQSRALAEGSAVFVDFTAAWCITCQFNKRTALADAGVIDDFDQRNIVTLRADWTRRDPEITRELTRLGRSGVPVYALHLPSGEAPVLLSEILRVAELRRVLEQAPSARADGSTSPVTVRQSR